MKQRRFLRTATAALTAVGLSAGLGVGMAGCAEGEASSVNGAFPRSGVAAARALPPLDAAAPATFETATFGLG